jgi:hypothetical protein
MDLFSGAVTSLMSALGLSAASGLNAYISLLTLGISHRMGWVALTTPYDWLGNEYVLLGIAVIGLIDLIGDKIPAVDHALHTVGIFIAPVAGAILFAGQSGAATNIHPVILLAAGCLVGGAVHWTRTAVRPVVTATTAGVGNPVVSAGEDLVASFLAMLAIFAPIAAGVFALILLCVLGWMLLRVWHFFRGRSPQQPLPRTDEPTNYSL